MSDSLAQARDQVPSPDRRVHARLPIRSISYVELDESNGGIVLNVSEGGLSVQAVASLMEEVLPSFRFQLPDSEVWVPASARISWTSPSKKLAGLEFIELRDDSRKRIREWLARESSPQRAIESNATTAPIEASAPRGEANEATLPTAVAAKPLLLAKATDIAPRRDVVPAVAPALTTPGEPIFGSASIKPREAATVPTYRTRKWKRVRPARSSATRRLARRLYGNGWVFGVIVAVLSIGSLAAGWAAGGGGLGKILGPIHPAKSSPGPAGGDGASDTMISNRGGSEIEVGNTSNQLPKNLADSRLKASDTVTRVSGSNAPQPLTGNFKRGQLLHQVDPAYPVAAKQQRIEGTVRLNVTIGEDGSVRSVALLSGPQILAGPAEKAVRQWRYSPTLLDGKPIQIQREVDLRFHFSDAPK